MFSTDSRAAEMHARQDFFYQQGRIDRQSRAARAARRSVVRNLLHGITVRAHTR